MSDSDITVLVIACAIAWPIQVWWILRILRIAPVLGPVFEPVNIGMDYVRDWVLLRVSRD